MPLNRTTRDGEDGATAVARLRIAAIGRVVDLLHLPALLSNFLRAQVHAPPAYRCVCTGQQQPR